MTNEEKAVVQAANALVNKKGWAYFGSYLGEALVNMKKLERLEDAVIRNRLAASKRKRREP